MTHRHVETATRHGLYRSSRTMAGNKSNAPARPAKSTSNTKRSRHTPLKRCLRDTTHSKHVACSARTRTFAGVEAKAAPQARFTMRGKSVTCLPASIAARATALSMEARMTPANRAGSMMTGRGKRRSGMRGRRRSRPARMLLGSCQRGVRIRNVTVPSRRTVDATTLFVSLQVSHAYDVNTLTLYRLEV